MMLLHRGELMDSNSSAVDFYRWSWLMAGWLCVIPALGFIASRYCRQGDALLMINMCAPTRIMTVE